MTNQKQIENVEVYRVDGFSCASCASTFEKNVKRINGVTDAQVNFGASKITVHGSTTLKDLEKAGSFENLKVRPEKEKEHQLQEGTIVNNSFWRKHITVIGAFIFVIFGFISHLTNGEENFVTILAFATSMVIGGFQLFKVGLINLSRLQFDMKTLMTIAVIGAAIIGEW